jgi:hypothetical protein
MSRNVVGRSRGDIGRVGGFKYTAEPWRPREQNRCQTPQTPSSLYLVIIFRWTTPSLEPTVSPTRIAKSALFAARTRCLISLIRTPAIPKTPEWSLGFYHWSRVYQWRAGSNITCSVKLKHCADRRPVHVRVATTLPSMCDWVQALGTIRRRERSTSLINTILEGDLAERILEAFKRREFLLEETG